MRCVQQVVYQYLKLIDLCRHSVVRGPPLRLEGLSLYAREFQGLIRQHFNQIMRIRRPSAPAGRRPRAKSGPPPGSLSSSDSSQSRLLGNSDDDQVEAFPRRRGAHTARHPRRACTLGNAWGFTFGGWARWVCSLGTRRHSEPRGVWEVVLGRSSQGSALDLARRHRRHLGQSGRWRRSRAVLTQLRRGSESPRRNRTLTVRIWALCPRSSSLGGLWQPSSVALLGTLRCLGCIGGGTQLERPSIARAAPVRRLRGGARPAPVRRQSGAVWEAHVMLCSAALLLAISRRGVDTEGIRACDDDWGSVDICMTGVMMVVLTALTVDAAVT